MDSKLEAEFVQLSWRLIEHKLMYYHPEKVHESWLEIKAIEDEHFDALQERYLFLCGRLGHANTIVHNIDEKRALMLGEGMFEIDFTRPSVQCVLKKLSKPVKNLFG